MEQEGTLPFLDVLLKRVDEVGNIETCVYRKPMAAKRVLPFDSAHNVGVKKGIVQNLVQRAHVVCSTPQTLQKELQTIRGRARVGGYPEGLVCRIIKQVEASLQGVGGGKVHSDTQCDVTRWGIAYYPGIHEQLQRMLSKFNIQVVAANHNNIKKMLAGVKDPIPHKEKKGIVYGLECSECPVTYTGESGQRLESRIYRHQLAMKNGDTEHYPLVEHCVKMGHNIKWDSVHLFTQELNLTKRRLLESLYIERDNKSTNKHEGVRHAEMWRWVLQECSLPKKIATVSFL
jgi:hypothetical protein